MDYQVHKTSIVEEGAQIGKESKIWHWTHICSKAIIGSNCVFGQNVYVGNKVRIGNNVKIQNNVSVYDNVTIQDDVFCGPSMVFTNIINPRSFVSRKHSYQDTLVKKGASIGANCTIVCGVEIGRYAFIGAGAVVTKNVPNYALMLGVPAIQVGWMSEYGERMESILKQDGFFICSKTGDKYLLNEGECQKTTS